MTLQQYIDQVGISNVARAIGEPKQIVSIWRNFEGVPRPHKALKLILTSNGQLDWRKIYEPFAEHYLEKRGVKREDLQLKFDF